MFVCWAWFVRNNNKLVIISINLISIMCCLKSCLICFLNINFIKVVGIIERIILRENCSFLFYLNWNNFWRILVIFFWKISRVESVVVVCKVMVMSKFFFVMLLLFRKNLVSFKCLLLLIGRNFVSFWMILSSVEWRIFFMIVYN